MLAKLIIKKKEANRRKRKEGEKTNSPRRSGLVKKQPAITADPLMSNRMNRGVHQ